MLRFVVTLALVCVTNVWASGVSGLMTAVKRGDTSLVAQIIKQLPIDSRDEHSRTAVHYAVEHSQVEILNTLLHSGADPNIIDAQGKTPYDLWEHHKDEDIARILEREKAKTSATVLRELFDQDAIYTKIKAASLFQATAAGDRETVESLLELGTDPKTKNSDGLFPFHIAVQNKHPAVAGILLRAMSGKDGKDDKSWTPMHWAVLAKDWEMLRELLREGAKFKYSSSSLGIRDYKNPYDIAKFIHAEEQFLAIVLAEQRDDIVKTIVEKAISNEDDEDIAFIYQLAKQHGLNLKEDEEIIKKGLLASMSFIKPESMFNLLLKYVKDRDGLSQVLNAAYTRNRYYRKKSTEILLGLGADPNALNSQGETAVIVYFKTFHAWQVNMDNKGQDVIKDIEELIEHGADLNATDANGKTALMLLVSDKPTYINISALRRFEAHCADLVEILLKHGADPSIKDNDGFSALDYAKKKEAEYKKTYDYIKTYSSLNREIIEILEQATHTNQ